MLTVEVVYGYIQGPLQFLWQPHYNGGKIADKYLRKC